MGVQLGVITCCVPALHGMYRGYRECREYRERKEINGRLFTVGHVVNERSYAQPTLNTVNEQNHPQNGSHLAQLPQCHLGVENSLDAYDEAMFGQTAETQG